MNDKQQIELLLNQNNGIITASEITKLNIPRRILTEMVSEESLLKAGRGIYFRRDLWEDEFFILCYQYSRGIFSHETALYLHKMTDRTPHSFQMTFPHGYNAVSLKNEIVSVKRVISDIYPLGKTKIKSPGGNDVNVYDVERTLCDLIRGNYKGDTDMINQAMKTYALSKNKNIYKLMDYANKLRVREKISNYMEVLQ